MESGILNHDEFVKSNISRAKVNHWNTICGSHLPTRICYGQRLRSSSIEQYGTFLVHKTPE